MILEGFEIENWSCLKKVSVSGLPAAGVIVIHGPNRTGKSSIVQALRACLMDYQSTTTALKSRCPRGTGEKPVVSVTFQVGGMTYRIKKHFGTNKSELASKTPAGAWKVETTSPADAHDRTCNLVGGADSTKGLHQLLWLTQAEFHLPEAKKFDANVQAQLREILGVLQTPLDDRFIERIKTRWNVWYSGQRKPGKPQSIKDSCKLAENLKKLTDLQSDRQESETKFHEIEALLRQATSLEQSILDLNRQLEGRTGELTQREEEQRRSQTRILARQHAEANHDAAEKERNAALAEQLQRAAAAQHSLDDDNAIEPARDSAATLAQRVQELEGKQTRQRSDLAGQRNKRRELQQAANSVTAKLRALADADRLRTAQSNLQRARAIADAIVAIEQYFIENPAPNTQTLEALKDNRRNAARLQADRDAASMNLTVIPENSAATAQLALDGDQLQELPTSSVPALYVVRRTAELRVANWGRVELSRGSGQGDLDKIEDELRQLEEHFVSAAAPFGITGSDPQAMDKLLQRVAEHQVKTVDLDNKRKELKKLTPQGLEPLQANVIELQAKLKDAPGPVPKNADPLPSEPNELDRLTANLEQQIASVEAAIGSLETDAETGESNLEQARRAETTAKEELAARTATAKSSREALDRLRTDEQIAQRIREANRAVENAQAQLEQTALTQGELTIGARLQAAQEAVGALQSQISENTSKYDVIKGRLLESEGLHARRSSLAARIDELTLLTERESLEKDAIDRLYALFEECREKQLGALMGPIHDRVLGWMRVLNIGDYQAVRFNDAFLPDKLLSRDGTAEFAVQEESTGAQEQIGMLTRLALGSILASPGQPAVALLDDPLTHCDIGRLNTLRVILRRAAEGDAHLVPPAGPLQIVILTCHPEWFRDAGATVIDLESPEIMTRWAV